MYCIGVNNSITFRENIFLVLKFSYILHFKQNLVAIYNSLLKKATQLCVVQHVNTLKELLKKILRIITLSTANSIKTIFCCSP